MENVMMRETFAALLALQATEMASGQTPALRGLIPQEEAAPQPHLPSCADFFWVPEVLNFFPKIKHSNAGGSDLCKQNNAPQVRGSWLPGIYFLDVVGPSATRKIVAKFPGGGGP
jgi:hypothetical protein